jgi:hypothetical protein
MRLTSLRSGVVVSIFTFVLFSGCISAARTRNSDYGFSCRTNNPCADQLSTPSFNNNITQTGITISLASVWCDSSTSNGTCPDTTSCPSAPCPNSTFDYLFDLKIGSGTTLNSMLLSINNANTNSAIALIDVGVVRLGDPCATNTCTVPFSDPTLTFAKSSASISSVPNSPGTYQVSFVGFDAATLGGPDKDIIFYVTAQEYTTCHTVSSGQLVQVHHQHQESI